MNKTEKKIVLKKTEKIECDNSCNAGIAFATTTVTDFSGTHSGKPVIVLYDGDNVLYFTEEQAHALALQLQEFGILLKKINEKN